VKIEITNIERKDKNIMKPTGSISFTVTAYGTINDVKKDADKISKILVDFIKRPINNNFINL